jgi:hypothetical protein
LELFAEVAYTHNPSQFLLIANWDLARHGDVIKKMMMLGNVSFRQLDYPAVFYALARDNREIMLAIDTHGPDSTVSITSSHKDYVNLFSQFIGPMIQAISKPIAK